MVANKKNWGPKVSSEKIAAILDRMALGGSMAAVARDTNTSKSFAYKLEEYFPLWGWMRSQHDISEE